jgi:hypothetical protein
LEDIALVDFHGVRNLGTDRFQPRVVESLDDMPSKVNAGSGLGLWQDRRLIIVGTIAQPSQRFQIASRLFYQRIATVAEAKDQVLMGTIGPRNGKP